MPLLEKQVLGSFVSLSSSPFVEPCCHGPSMTRRDVPVPGHSECTCSSEGWQGIPSELPASGLSKKLWLAEGHMLVTPSASLISSSPSKCLLIERQSCQNFFSS